MKPQCVDLLNYLKRNGSITPIDALNKLNIMALSQRIGNLRNDYGFADEIMAVMEKTASGKLIARYHWRGQMEIV